MVSVSKTAQQLIEKNGGSVSEKEIIWPQSTVSDGGSDRGGWGNFSIRYKKLPDGHVLSWDSDDREWQYSHKGAKPE